VAAPNPVKVPLVKDTISQKELLALSDWIQTFPRLTKGELTLKFEEQWSKWQGCKYSVFVNSGSSANLLMFYALLLSGRLRNKKVIVPAVSWVTTVSPAIQFGFEPIVCDCDPETLGLDTDHLGKLVEQHDPAAIILVHVLGFPNKMDEIMAICSERDIVLLEDSCESLGSEYRGVKTGNFGQMSSFSLYFGHHLSTIEGGMVCTDDEDLKDLLVSLRSHGWDRDLSTDKQKELRSKYEIDEFRALYTFYYPGFNVRSTDLQAFLGLEQLKKADTVVENRNKNFLAYDSTIKEFENKVRQAEGTLVSNFCYPLITEKRDELVAELARAGVDSRPLVCGSIARHPFWYERYGHADLPFADIVHDTGMYIPNNHEMTEAEVEYVADVVNSVL
jgi:CDP-4-dehydro-6-deoxyglucose reductase, E1